MGGGKAQSQPAQGGRVLRQGDRSEGEGGKTSMDKAGRDAETETETDREEKGRDRGRERKRRQTLRERQRERQKGQTKKGPGVVVPIYIPGD